MLKKILDLLFRALSRLILIVLKIFGLFYKKKIRANKNSVAALPYYPKNWPGGHDRIANWKYYFENDNVKFDVFWASNDQELLNYFETTSEFKRYYLFILCLFRRAFLFLKLLKYDCIWIQRAYIPYYPYQDSYFESLLVKFHSNVIIDFYDADYLSNYNLTINSVKAVNKVSVSTTFLKDYYKSYNDIFLLRMTIDQSKYLIKKRYDQKHIRIGWMGNPDNIKYIKIIEKELQNISQKYDHISFHFLCRELPGINIKNLYTYNWDNTHFEYYQWLSSIDIGIIPYIGDTDRLKAKSAMKTLEFMASAIPMITTNHGNFEDMVDGRDYLLANTNEDWSKHLCSLIESPSLRENIGVSSNLFFLKHHTYKANYSSLKKIFFN